MEANMKMQRTTISLVLAASIAMILMPASAQMTDGRVVKVDRSASKITIRHGPMKKFDMDEGMTMVYRVQNPAVLETVKAGDKIKFDADRIDGQFTVTRIQR